MSDIRLPTEKVERMLARYMRDIGLSPSAANAKAAEIVSGMHGAMAAAGNLRHRAILASLSPETLERMCGELHAVYPAAPRLSTEEMSFIYSMIWDEASDIL